MPKRHTLSLSGMKILGIDPGTARIGYAVIEDGAVPQLLLYGTIEPREKDPHRRLSEVVQRFTRLLIDAAPELIAIEKLYFSRNQKTALAVAHTRGALVAECAARNLPILEIGPMEVKLAATGYGKSDKKAVAEMMKRIFKVSVLEGYDDASDAIAIAFSGGSKRRFETL